MTSSRIPGFYRLDPLARRTLLAEASGLTRDDLDVLQSGGLTSADADAMIENMVGILSIPVGIATNFIVNGTDCLVPMAIEEPSVVAAASHAAKLARPLGGFTSVVSDPVMIAQIQIREVPAPIRAAAQVQAASGDLLSKAKEASPKMVARGGGPIGIEVRVLENREDTGTLVVHLLVDCRDAMGANIVNSLAETMAEPIAKITGGKIGLRILSNLSTRRMVNVTTEVGFSELGGGKEGQTAAQEIVEASRFAELDPYRAATHNKGIMNGVDAVLLATMNDWRGVEAGAHAYAAQSGSYQPLATWRLEEDCLLGQLKMPLAIGTVGGSVGTHPVARVALKIIGSENAARLTAIAGACGLATNLAALRALAKEGIQSGHMPLHHRKSESIPPPISSKEEDL